MVQPCRGLFLSSKKHVPGVLQPKTVIFPQHNFFLDKADMIMWLGLFWYLPQGPFLSPHGSISNITCSYFVYHSCGELPHPLLSKHAKHIIASKVRSRNPGSAFLGKNKAGSIHADDALGSELAHVKNHTCGSWKSKACKSPETGFFHKLKCRFQRKAQIGGMAWLTPPEISMLMTIHS